MQITENAVLLTDAEVSTKSMDVWSDKPYLLVLEKATHDYEPVIVQDATARIDGDWWSGFVVPDGTVRYKTVLGATKSVDAYRAVTP
jgi:hypothetical protein